MIRPLLAVSAAVLCLSVLPAASARAEPLTCATFRDRFNGALLASGQRIDAPDFKQGSRNPTRGTRFDWLAGSVSGELSCGPADQFEEFGIELRFTKRDGLADDLKRLLTLQGASICALADGTTPACTEFGRAMLETAMAQMGRAFSRGVKQPSGLSEQKLSGSLRATLTSAPTLITFLVGPGRGESLDAGRSPLAAPVSAPPPG